MVESPTGDVPTTQVNQVRLDQVPIDAEAKEAFHYPLALPIGSRRGMSLFLPRNIHRSRPPGPPRSETEELKTEKRAPNSLRRIFLFQSMYDVPRASIPYFEWSCCDSMLMKWMMDDRWQCCNYLPVLSTLCTYQSLTLTCLPSPRMCLQSTVKKVARRVRCVGLVIGCGLPTNCTRDSRMNTTRILSCHAGGHVVVRRTARSSRYTLSCSIQQRTPAQIP